MSECSFKFDLRKLLHYTVKRIHSTVQLDAFHSFLSEKVHFFSLIRKWGCDGTTGESKFKQEFKDDDGNKSDESIFLTSLVPSQLELINATKHDSKIVWKNPRPFSTRVCSSVKIECIRETLEVIQKIVEHVKQQTRNLESFEKTTHGKKISINFSLFLTMVDQKVCNFSTDTTSAQGCF